MDCETGASWGQHVLWMFFFMYTAPVTAGTGDQDDAPIKVPICGWTGNSAIVYAWFSTILQSSDQYMDNNTAAMARACGAHGLWQAMLGFYVASLFLQVCTALFSPAGDQHMMDMRISSAFAILAGANVEVMFREGNAGCSWMVGELGDAEREQRNDYLTRTGAWVNIARMLTESIPEAVFAIYFANSRGLTGTALANVYFSVALSVGFGCKIGIEGVQKLRNLRPIEDASDRA